MAVAMKNKAKWKCSCNTMLQLIFLHVCRNKLIRITDASVTHILRANLVYIPKFSMFHTWHQPDLESV